MFDKIRCKKPKQTKTIKPRKHHRHVFSAAVIKNIRKNTMFGKKSDYMADLKESEVHRGGVEEYRRHVQQHCHLPRVRPVALHHALDDQLALVFFSGGAAAGD